MACDDESIDSVSSDEETLAQVRQPVASRGKAAGHRRSTAEKVPLVPDRFLAELCNRPETVLVNRSLLIIDGNQQRLTDLRWVAILPEDQKRVLRRIVLVKDSTNPSAAPEHPPGDAAKRFPSNICVSLFLPRKIYEALPAAYIAAGTLFIVGASYIGIDHRPVVGYLAVGLSCILAGVTVSSIRRRERSKSANALA